MLFYSWPCVDKLPDLLIPQRETTAHKEKPKKQEKNYHETRSRPHNANSTINIESDIFSASSYYIKIYIHLSLSAIYFSVFLLELP